MNQGFCRHFRSARPRAVLHRVQTGFRVRRMSLTVTEGSFGQSPSFSLPVPCPTIAGLLRAISSASTRFGAHARARCTIRQMLAEPELIHGESRTESEKSGGEKIENSRCIDAAFVQSGHTYSNESDRCHASSPTPGPFSIEKEQRKRDVLEHIAREVSCCRRNSFVDVHRAW